MKINEFVGKAVYSPSLRERLVIDSIDGVYIEVRTEKQNQYGTHGHYRYFTGTVPSDNAIENGELIFEDRSLFEPFKAAFADYCRNKGKHDQYLYYSRFYD